MKRHIALYLRSIPEETPPTASALAVAIDLPDSDGLPVLPPKGAGAYAAQVLVANLGSNDVRVLCLVDKVSSSG